MNLSELDSVEVAIQAFTEGRPVIIMDDERRENEGDLCVPASLLTADHLRLYRKYTTNKICVACSPRRTEELKLPLMEVNNTDPNQTPFTITVDLVGTGTGISISNQLRTIQALADPAKRPSDFTRPGHVQPLRASPKGLYGRQGHTESSVELCKLAGLYPVCVIAEILREDGEEARFDECKRLAQQERFSIISISQLVDFLPKPTISLPLQGGEVMITTYFTNYIVLSKGEIRGQEKIPLRIHSECITGDLFGSRRCDCRSQLEQALHRLHTLDRGILIYIRGQEGRGIGLENKMLAYTYQQTGQFDTITANLELHLPIDGRTYEEIPRILEDLGVKSVILFTNNPEKVKAVGRFLESRVDDVGRETLENRKYLETKRTLHMATFTKKIGIVYTRCYHSTHVQTMLFQCREYLKDYTLVERGVSGSFELTFATQKLLQTGCEVVITLGILLKEETAHFDAILNSIVYGLTQVQLREGKPVIFGVLACYTREQIEARVNGNKNHVKEWCEAAIDMIK